MDEFHQINRSGTDTRPIIFSTPMVLAILAGRKTMSRRLVKPQPKSEGDSPYRIGNGEYAIARACPYGKVGDILWVRETWRPAIDDVKWDCIEYKADGARIKPSIQNENTGFKFSVDCDDAAESGYARWRPSIHMPRWASRLSLVITNTRIERLHAITGKDILAEGAILRAHDDAFGHNPVSAFDGKVYMDLTSLWARGWESIYGKGAWAANPWVWVVQFKVLANKGA